MGRIFEVGPPLFDRALNFLARLAQVFAELGLVERAVGKRHCEKEKVDHRVNCNTAGDFC
jgi:hypothetical protein